VVNNQSSGKKMASGLSLSPYSWRQMLLQPFHLSNLVAGKATVTY